MSTITTTERALYADVWTSVPLYGEFSPGERYLPIFLHLVGTERGTVLDAGTGSGKGALALTAAGFDVRVCDVTDAGLVPAAKDLLFTEACLWQDLRHVTRGFGHPGRTKADYLYCTDVLEHIPPQFTMLAIWQMLQVCAKGAFFAVSFVHDGFGAWVGSPLHQTVQPFLWWKDSIGELGTIIEARDLIGTGTFWVRPR